MTSRYPWQAAVLSVIASSTFLLLIIPYPYPIALALLYWAQRLSGCWAVVCLCVWRQGHRHWRAWRVSPTWVTTPAELHTPIGLCLGQGFLWDATHVQTLEAAILADGGLPVAQGPRGGYPALHAVRAQADRLFLTY